MKLNDYLPKIEVDPQNYHVYADGQLLLCEPSEVVPLAQRYFLFQPLGLKVLTFKKIKYWEGNCQKIFLNHEQRKSGRLKLKYKDREDIFITGDRSEVILNGDY